MWHPSTFATTGNLMFHLVPSFCWCKQVTNAPTFHCAIEHVIRKASLPTVLLFQRIFRPGSGSPQEKKAGGSWVTWQSKWSFSGFWGETNLGKLNVAWRSKHFVLVEPIRGRTTTPRQSWASPAPQNQINTYLDVLADELIAFHVWSKTRWPWNKIHEKSTATTFPLRIVDISGLCITSTSFGYPKDPKGAPACSRIASTWKERGTCARSAPAKLGASQWISQHLRPLIEVHSVWSGNCCTNLSFVHGWYAKPRW